LEDVLGSETTGWGFERKCRNFDGLFKWSERWRSDDGAGLLDKIA
jgi:hypothetical protein